VERRIEQWYTNTGNRHLSVVHPPYITFPSTTYRTQPKHILRLQSMSKSESSVDLIILFTKIGLSKAKAEEAAKSPKSSAILKEIIECNNDVLSGIDEKKATLLSNLSIALSKTSDIDVVRRDYVVKAILESKLATVDQISGENSVRAVKGVSISQLVLSAAVKYLRLHKPPIDDIEFNKECGVGL